MGVEWCFGGATMKRRMLFSLPVALPAAMLPVHAKAAPVKPMVLDLPQTGEWHWERKLTKALREVEAAVNQLRDIRGDT